MEPGSKSNKLGSESDAKSDLLGSYSIPRLPRELPHFPQKELNIRAVPKWVRRITLQYHPQGMTPGDYQGRSGGNSFVRCMYSRNQWGGKLKQPNLGACAGGAKIAT